jgi:UDPglucose 6-dehydrogenase
MNICIIGTGYVGLVTGVCFADMGNNVVCVDVDAAKIKGLSEGKIPIYEPGLEELVKQNTKEGRLSFTTDLKEGITDALFCFIAVGTPTGEDGSADLSYVMNVAASIGMNMGEYKIIVNKSTVPVGTADLVRLSISEQLTQRGLGEVEFDIVSNPEFLKEGDAINDFMKPDRIIVGTENVRTAELMKQLYDPFVRNQHPIYIMDTKSAELSKYAANAMLATRISFMNEMARLCDEVGADIANVRLGLGSDKRIGMSFLYAGAGYGGSCFPKDIRALIRTGEKYNSPLNIVDAVEKSNERQKYYLLEMILKKFGQDLSGKKFGVWGLAFKPQTDDMREAPSIVVIKELIKHGAKVTAYDPEATTQAKIIFNPHQFGDKLTYTDTTQKAALEADAIILLTEWRQFRQVDLSEIKKIMTKPILFDGRNQYDPLKMRQMGFEYYCIGRNYNVR